MVQSRKIMTLLTVLIIVMMIGLVGCGKQESAGNSPETKKTGISDQQSEQQKDTRMVKDEFGEVEIPVKPKRVAAIYLEDYMKALEVTPIVQWYHPSWGKQDYLNLDVPEFDITGSIEALLDQNPDLIIVDGVVDAAKYEMYSKIAPTYRLPEEILQQPMEITKTIADLLGVPEKAESVVTNYTQKIKEGKEKLQKSLGDETVAVVRLNVADKTLALFGIENRFTGNIYKEMGLTPHPLARDMKEFQEILSEEKLPELDADHIIIFPSNGSWSSDENKEAIKLLDGPMWKSVPAVKKGRVYQAERTYWQSGAITANSMKMDDLLKWFVK